MKIKNYNRTILTFLVIMMVALTIPFTSQGALMTHKISFEGFPAPGQYTDSFMKTEVDFGYCNISSSNVRSGTRCYQLSTTVGGGAYMNFTGEYITNFSYYEKILSPSGTAYFYIGLYNHTLAIRNGMGIHVSPSGEWKKGYLAIIYISDTGKVYYMNEVGASIQLGGTWPGAWGLYVRHGIRFINDIGDIKYQIGNTFYNGVSCNGTAIYEGYKVDRAYIWTSNNCGIRTFDDMNITFETSYSGGVGAGCIDTSGLTQIGHFAYSTYSYSYPYIIKKYHVPITTIIKAVNIECNLAQLSDDGDLANYILYINGLSVGMPLCSYVIGDDVVFQWSCDVNLTNEAPVFTFYHSKKTSGGHYWKIGTTTYAGGGDLDSDGDTTYYLAGSGFVPSSNYPGSYSASAWGDLGMMWFCTGFTTDNIYTYGDTLGLDYWDYSNATGYVYNIQSPYGIVCAYTLSTISKAYNCRIELWKNGTQTYTLGFPQYVSYPSGSIAIAPTTIGKYHFKLYNYHYIKNVTAWVTGTPGNFQIFINPKISNQFAPYTVTCRYYHPQGLKGYVGVFDNVSKVNSFSKALHTYPVSDNSTTNIYYSSNSSKSEYWQLFAYSTTYAQVGQYSIHYVRLPFAMDNSIQVLTKLLKLGDGTFIRATHTFPGADISIYINGIKWKEVGGNQISQHVYIPTKTGIHNATLRKIQNGTTVLLAYDTFTVTEATGTKPTGDLEGLTKELIPEEYRLYIGIGIIIGFTLLPTIILLSYAKHTESEIHVPALPLTITTIIMSLIGFILTIIWGLMPWYTVFLILFVLILYLGILMFKGSKQEE